MTLADTNSSQRTLDSIRITGISATGFHGVLQSERESGQEFRVDLTLGLSLGDAAEGDDLDKTVNYAHVAEAVVEVISGPPLNLIETVAERIAAVVLENPLVWCVDVTVHKPQAPIPVPFGGVEVTVSRSRENMPRVARPFVEVGADAVATLPSWAQVNDEHTEPQVDSSLEDTVVIPLVVDDAYPVIAEPVIAEPVVDEPVTDETAEAVEPDPVVSLSNEIASGEEETSAHIVEPSNETTMIPQVVLAGLDANVVTASGAVDDDIDMALETGEDFESAEHVESAEHFEAVENSDPVELEVPQLVEEGSDPVVEQTTDFAEPVDPAEPVDAAVPVDPAEPLNPVEAEEVDGAAVVDEAAVVEEASETTSVLEVEDAQEFEGSQDVDEVQETETDVDSNESANAEPDVETLQPTTGAETTDASNFFEAVATFEAESAAEAISAASAEVAELNESELETSELEASDAETTTLSDSASWQPEAETSEIDAAVPAAQPEVDAPKIPTLSELLGGDRSQPLDLSKPLFLSQDVVELPPLPSPFFESPKGTQPTLATATAAASTLDQAETEPTAPAEPTAPTESIAPTDPAQASSHDVSSAPADLDLTPYQPVFIEDIAPSELASREQTDSEIDSIEPPAPLDAQEPYVPQLSFDQVISGEVDPRAANDAGFGASGSPFAPVTGNVSTPQSSSSSQVAPPETSANANLSESAQQRLEERFAAMMSEHFGIDVPRSPQTTSTPVVEQAVVEQAGVEQAAVEQGIAEQPAVEHTAVEETLRTEPVIEELSNAAGNQMPTSEVSYGSSVGDVVVVAPELEPEPWAAAIPVIESGDGYAPAVESENAQPVSPFAPTSAAGDVNTMVIPQIEDPTQNDDLVRGGTAIIEPQVHARPHVAARDTQGSAPLMTTLDQLDEVPEHPARVVLALGANMGDAQGTLVGAVRALEATHGFEIVKVGPLALTAAVGGPEQGDYYNSVVIGQTTLSPRELLKATQAIENAHMRTREVRWGPRTLDIDIVVYGDVVATADDLEIPHPRANERAFVLVPWEEADPQAYLPGLGGGPVAALAATAHDRSGIRWLALNWLD